MLDSKIALVTGASRGIGKAIAEKLAEQGATVVGTATTEAGANKMSHCKGMVLDISNPESIENLISTLTETVGMPQILINNAGITRDNLFMRLSDDDWDNVIVANLTGVFKLMRACIRPMIKAKWGRIVNISSVVAFSGNPGQANYAAAKAGVVGLSKSVAHEVASRGITVNVVAPGFIATDMTDKLSETQQEQLIEKIPAKKMGHVSDIAGAVSYLVSDSASYVTGETIHVNGGMLMT